MSKRYVTLAEKAPFATREVRLVECDELYIHPLSDIHVEAHAHEREALLEKVQEVKEAGENHRILLLGDLADIAIAGTPSFAHGARTPDEALASLEEIFEPVASQIDLMIPGNHERRTKKAAGLDFLSQLAARLRIPDVYRPLATVVRYGFYGRQSRNRKGETYLTPRAHLELYCHHGYGGGRRSGSKLNKAIELRLQKSDADVYLMGHVHEQIGKVGRCVAGWPPRSKEQRFVITGCYLGSESYAINQAYEPVAVGSPVVRAWVYIQADRYHLRTRVEL